MIYKIIFTLMVTISFLSVASAESKSQFTSVEPADCIIKTASDETSEIDFYNVICPSFGGYEVSVSGGDIRYNLKLKYNGVEIPTEDAGGAFHDMASDKVEWVYNVVPGKRLWDWKLTFSAMIYKITFSTYDEDRNQSSDEIVVVMKLDGEKSCQTGQIIMSKTKNAMEEARKIADNPKAQCL